MDPRRPIVPGTFTLPFERRNRAGSPEAQRGSERAALTRRARTRPVTLAPSADPLFAVAPVETAAHSAGRMQ